MELPLVVQKPSLSRVQGVVAARLLRWCLVSLSTSDSLLPTIFVRVQIFCVRVCGEWETQMGLSICPSEP